MEDEIITTTFEQWVEHLFEEQPAMSLAEINALTTWFDYDDDPAIEVEYIRQLFADPVKHLSNYSDEQINTMLWILINEIETYLYELFNEEIALELRVQVVKEMYTVFEQLFAPRCTNSMSSFKEKAYLETLNPLNSICFMWWDIIPLYGKSGDPNREVLDPYCIDVMEQTLALKSIACQEAALHGLGHWKSAYPERIEKIIDDFLVREIHLDSELRRYAFAARTGMVL